MSNTTRIGPDGKPAPDLTENPKAISRKTREAEGRARLEKEQVEPWRRAKIERELARLSTQEFIGVVNGREVKNSINLSGVDLSGQDLSGLDLSGANLHGAKLSGAKMNGCRLVGANLHDADLTDAEMDDTNAVEANFHGACLCRAKVGRTHFMKANLSECCHEETDGLDISTRPLTSAENAKARRKQAEGFRVHISVDRGTVCYYGPSLDHANVTGMSTKCKRK